MKQSPLLFESDTEEIRALWWNQPFATLMLPPYLKDETRTRATNVRGKVLICACKNPYPYSKVMQISGDYQQNRISEVLLRNHEEEERLPVGFAIGIGNLTDCFPMKPEHSNKCFVRYREPWTEQVKKKTKAGNEIIKQVKRALWVWHFEDVQKIEPFEIPGKQGWAILDEETKAKIKIINQ